jgi:hypothetical protein
MEEGNHEPTSAVTENGSILPRASRKKVMKSDET